MSLRLPDDFHISRCAQASMLLEQLLRFAKFKLVIDRSSNEARLDIFEIDSEKNKRFAARIVFAIALWNHSLCKHYDKATELFEKEQNETHNTNDL